MIAYEQRLSQEVWGALREGSMHFEKESAVHKTLAALVNRLDKFKIPYALVGWVARPALWVGMERQASHVHAKPWACHPTLER
jgi:hypothetical protein